MALLVGALTLVTAAAHAQTAPTNASLKEWDIFGSTGGDWNATQNIASVALDAVGVAGPAGSLWMAAQYPRPRLGRLDPSSSVNSYIQWPAVLDRDAAGPAMGVALNTANGDVWITMQGDPSLVVKLAGTNTFRRFRLANPLVPDGIVATSDHAAIVALPYRNTLGIGDALIKVPRSPSGGAVIATVWAVGGMPRHVAIDRSGHVWFSQNSANKIGRLNLANGVLHEWALPTSSFPSGITIAGAAVCLASEGGMGQLTGAVQCLDVDTNQITGFARATGDGFDLPQQVALNSAGEMFVTEQNGNSLSFIAAPARSTATATAVTPTVRTVVPTTVSLDVQDVVSTPTSYTITPTQTTLTGSDNGYGYSRFALSPVTLTFPFEMTGSPQPASMTPVVNDWGQGSGAVFFSEFFNGPMLGRRAAARIGRLELVVPRPPPSMTVTPSTLQFEAMSGAAAPASQAVAITETNGQPLSWTASTTAAWLRLTPSAGDAPSTMTVTVDHSALAAGSYSDVITVDDGPGGADPRTIVVELDVAPPSPVISLSPGTLSFSTLRGRNPSTQTVTLTNAGSATLSFGAGASTTSGGAWLSVSPSTGTLAPGGNTTLTATVASSGLASGSYTGTMTVSDPAATNSPQTVAVSLTVTPAPTITLLPTTLTFTGTRWTTCNGVQSGSTVASQTIAVGNSGDATLNYTATASGGSWLSVSPTSGLVSPGTTGNLAVAVDIRNLARGTYNGLVTVADPNATNSSQLATVTLTIGPASATLCVTPESVDFGTVARSSTTASQILQILNVGDEPMGGWNATATASKGTVNLSSTSGNAPDSIAVSVTTTNARGNQTGTITITAAGAVNSVTVNLTWTVN